MLGGGFTPVLPAGLLHLSSPSVHHQSFAGASNICWEQFVSWWTLEGEFPPARRERTRRHTKALLYKTLSSAALIHTSNCAS